MPTPRPTFLMDSARRQAKYQVRRYPSCTTAKMPPTACKRNYRAGLTCTHVLDAAGSLISVIPSITLSTTGCRDARFASVVHTGERAENMTQCINCIQTLYMSLTSLASCEGVADASDELAQDASSW